LCAPAYNILVVSYNTVPLWSLVLGTSAGLAAIREKRAAPTITATLALAAGVACYPPMVVAAAPMLAVVLLRARSREVTRWVVVVGTAARHRRRPGLPARLHGAGGERHPQVCR
jgi:hypothetical protein